jgi:hypothetical protein
MKIVKLLQNVKVVGSKLFKSMKQISEIEREMVQFVENLRIFGGN